MFIRIVLSLLIVIIFFSPSANSKLNLTLTPRIQSMTGHTEYSLDVTFNTIDSVTLIPVTETIASLLEFPLDNVIVGFGFKLKSPTSNKWSINGSFGLSVKDPGDKMFDSDWHGKLPFFDRTLYSFTESDVTMKMFQADINYRHRIMLRTKTSFYAMVGFKYQRIEQDVINFSGWQRFFDDVDNSYGSQFNFTFDELAIVYKLNYYIPYFGLVGDFNLSEKLLVNLSAAYSFSYFTDSDDHVLRNKLSTADGNGNSLLLSGSNRIVLNQTKNGKEFFIEIYTDYLKIDISGAQTQSWYDDEGYTDPVTDEFIVLAEEGTIITGVPHKIKSDQFSIGFIIGFTF
jgi:outer membrane protease